MNSDAIGGQYSDLPDGLFPLPLNSIERFHLYDYSDEFTNIGFGEFKFEGIVESEAAQQALMLTLARHPLWGCRIESIGGRLHWQPDFDRFRDIDWHQPFSGTPALPPFDPLVDPTPGPVSRVAENRTSIAFTMQHAVCDGIGFVQFVSDWMKFYHNIVSGDVRYRRIRKLELEELVHRNRLGMLSRDYLEHLWKQPLGLFGATKFIFRRPAEIRPDVMQVPPWDYHRQPWIFADWFEESVSDGIRNRAKSEQVMLNTMLVGELFRILDEICQSNPANRSKWLRIILPMSIRTVADRRLPACNRTTVVQIDRSQRKFDDPQFYRGLDREIRIIREWHLGKLFLLAVRGMSAIPGQLQRAASNGKCRGTAVFANLSEPFGRLGLPVEHGRVRIGNLVLDDFDLIGPIRHRMPVYFMFLKHQSRFRLILHADPRVLEESEAQEIFSGFYNRIANLA